MARTRSADRPDTAAALGDGVEADLSVKFAVVVHAHQPPDNYDSVFQEALERSYAPFFGLLESMPDVRVSAHFSGSLLEWLEHHAPTFIRQFRRLVERGQVELVAAGLQEPVLALLPEHDRA